MEKKIELITISYPRIYLVRMGLFLFLFLVFSSVIYPQLKFAFFANAGLNGFILLLLFLGVAYTFRQVIILFREVRWLNEFCETGQADNNVQPRLLAPVASMFSNINQKFTPMSPQAMRSILETVSARLDEEREIGRYLIALLVFLGLLGTFWGLLDTVSSIANVFNNLEIESGESGLIFEQLKVGLEGPMRGMGTAFSSSLFGLGSSLALGFLELQASQAQNNFYTELENLLSGITNVKGDDNNQRQGESLAHANILIEINKTLNLLNMRLRAPSDKKK